MVLTGATQGSGLLSELRASEAAVHSQEGMFWKHCRVSQSVGRRSAVLSQRTPRWKEPGASPSSYRCGGWGQKRPPVGSVTQHLLSPFLMAFFSTVLPLVCVHVHTGACVHTHTHLCVWIFSLFSCLLFIVYLPWPEGELHEHKGSCLFHVLPVNLLTVRCLVLTWSCMKILNPACRRSSPGRVALPFVVPLRMCSDSGLPLSSWLSGCPVLGIETCHGGSPGAADPAAFWSGSWFNQRDLLWEGVTIVE